MRQLTSLKRHSARSCRRREVEYTTVSISLQTSWGSIQTSVVQRPPRHIDKVEHRRCKYNDVDYAQKSNIYLGIALAEGFRSTAEEG